MGRRATTMVYCRGALAETDYDAAGQVSAVRNLTSARVSFTYDADGNATVGNSAGSLATSTYDNAYQLTREQRSGTNAYDVAYGYDAVGNRLTKLEAGVATSYSYDAANQLNYEYTPSVRTSYSYDANGNTTLVNAAGALTTTSWDLENRQTVVRLAAGTRTTATYDGDGARRSYHDAAGYRNLLWDGQNVARETNTGGTTTAAYTYAPRGYGALLSQRRSGARAYHHFDALGSTQQLTDASQAVTDSYLYRAFGEQTVLSGSNANPFTWIGELGYYRQAEAGDYWMRARVYSPARGRWVSRDTAEEGANWYRYAAGDPTERVDPSGLWWRSLHKQWTKTAASVAGFSSFAYVLMGEVAEAIDNVPTLGSCPARSVRLGGLSCVC